MKLFKQIVRILVITLLSLLLIMAALPLLFPSSFKEKITLAANSSINGTIEFKNAGISFFRHFPNLTFSLDDFTIKGSAPYQQDTLFEGRSISAGINILSLLKGEIEVNGIYLDGVSLNMIIGKDGRDNFSIIKESDVVETPAEDGAAGANIKIDYIKVRDGHIRYMDNSLNMIAEIIGLNYKGKGRMTESYFTLASKMEIDSLSFIFDGARYLDNKRVEARMLTGMNIDSMKFNLIKNEIKVADLGAEFHGLFALHENGYEIDFSLNTQKSGFKELFTLMPHEYSEWSAQTKISGKAAIGIRFQGEANDSVGTSPDLSILFDVKNGKISYLKTPVPIENIDIKGTILFPSLDPERMAIYMENLSFILGGGKNKASFEMKGLSPPTIKADLKGSVDLAQLTKALGFSTLKFGGLLEYKAEMNGSYDNAKRVLPVIDAKITMKDGMVSTTRYPGTLHDFNADVSVKDNSGKYADLRIIADPFSFIFDDKPFTFTAKMEDFDNLKYDITSRGDLNLDNLYKLFALEGITLKGEIATDLKLKGRQEDARSGRYQRLDNSGTVEFHNFEFMSDDYPYPFIIPEGRIIVDKDKAWLKDAEVRYRENSVRLDGYARNFMGYYFENGDLTGRMSIKSESFNLDDFRFMFDGEGDTTASTGVVMMPDDMDLSLEADIKQINFSGTRIEKLKGEVTLKDGSAELRNTSMKLAGALFNMSAQYKPLSNDQARFGMNVSGDSFDIHRAYNEIPLFKEMMGAAENIYGSVSAQYTLNGNLDKEMSPVYPSLKGSGFIRLDDVKVKGLKILGEISKATGRDSINNPQLKGVLIKSHINNNIITIERTRMKILGFRPRFEGQTSFDGRLNIKFRLGLPPLGIVGIPVTVTGTMENPKISLRRGRNGDILYETESTDE